MLRSKPLLTGLALAALLSLALSERMEAGERAPRFSLKGLDGEEVVYTPPKGAPAQGKLSAPLTIVIFLNPGQEASRLAVKDFRTALRRDAAWASRVRAIAVASGTLEQPALESLSQLVPPECGVTGALDPEYAAYKGFGVIALPTSFVIGADGVIAAVLPGRPASFRKRLVAAIREALGIVEAPKAKAAPTDPKARRVDRLRKAADELLRRRRYAEGLAMLEAARKLRQDDVDLLASIGEVYLALERGDEAAAVFAQGAKLDPKHRGARRGVAKAGALVDDDLDAAEKVLRAELRRPPVDPDLYYYLGRLMERNVRPVRAAAAYRAAFERLRRRP